MPSMFRSTASVIPLTCMLGFTVIGYGFAAEPTGDVIVRPKEYPHALRNPLKGFRPDTRAEKNRRHPYATLTRCYLKWNELENGRSDGIDKIRQACNRKWKDVEKYNIKVIPRVYLDWDEKQGNEYWPADMTTGDFASEQFTSRVVRLVARLGQCWDTDPRVAWVQMGIIGYWGEHHHPAPDAAMQRLLGDAFTKAFANKLVSVRHPWEFTDYRFGVYWDSWAHVQQMKQHGGAIADLNARGRFRTAPLAGECAYNWGRYREQPGENPNDTLRDPIHRDFLVNSIRRLHGSSLGWVANYDARDPQVAAGADAVQRAFGYRFVLDEVRYTARPTAGRSFGVRFKVRNTGSAPFYYNWPVEVSLLDPQSRKPVWKDTFRQVDIRQWQPGDRWNDTTGQYEIPPRTYASSGNFTLPTTLEPGRYIVALAILDPAGMLPSARFATHNYFTGGRHPIGHIGIGIEPVDPALDPATFDDPAKDQTLHYVLP